MNALLLALLAAWTIPQLPPEAATREVKFADPPGSCRLLPIRHHSPEDVELHDRELATLARRGFGGFAICISTRGIDKPGPSYVENEANWPPLRHALDRAKEARFAAWLYDEAGYPSGSGRDLTLKGHPEWESTGYLVATARVKGGEKAMVKMPPGAFRVAWACALDSEGRICGKFADISECVKKGKAGTPPAPFAEARTKPMDADGRPEAGFEGWRSRPWIKSFDYEAPKSGGEWLVVAVTEDWVFEGTQAECKGMKTKFRHPNPLVAAATERFLAVNHETYAKHLGDDLGRHFASTFTDEPHVMAAFWRKMPYKVLPSSPEMAGMYEKRTGRRLFEDIPYLVAEAADDASAGPRIAFWNLVGDLFADNFLGVISKWCRAHGFLSGGHLMGETEFSFHVSHYGDFFRAMRRLDSPSIDCLTSEPPMVGWWDALYAGSARELNESRYVMCEVSNHSQNHRKPRYIVSDDEVRGTLHRLLWGGVNTFTSYYALNDRDDRRMRRINLELGRLNALLRDGHSAADIAILYPAEDAQAAYVPLETGTWEGTNTPVRQVEGRFYAAAKALYEDGRCFMFTDSPGILEAKIEGAELVHGKLRWRTVVTTGVRHGAAVKAKLAEFAAAGGQVIACVPNAAYRTEPALGFGLYEPGDEKEMLSQIRARFEAHVKCPQHGTPHPLRVVHRRTAQGDVLFVMNDSAQPWRGTVHLGGGDVGNVQLWDPEEGTHGMARRDKAGALEVDLETYGAIVFTTERPLVPRRLSPLPGKMALPDGFAQPVKVSSRNFEAGVVELCPGARRLTGTVQKVDSDSFLFVHFNADRAGLIPEGARGFVLKVNVPEDQPGAPALGIFVETPAGAFYASTGASLAKKGELRVEVPFMKFRAHRHHGAFSPADIVKLQVGFGGHKGPAGLKFVFDVLTPEVY